MSSQNPEEAFTKPLIGMSETAMHPDTGSTHHVQQLVARISDGDTTAREQLLQATCDRLLELTRKIKRDFPKVARWEQTEDVFQAATIRLCRALESADVIDARHYFRLAAMQIRRQLIDLSRHYQGACGLGAHHQSAPDNRGDVHNEFDPVDAANMQTDNPRKLAEWAEFHEQVDRLPESEKEVFDLLWYHALTQQEVADTLGVDVRTVKRRWRSARLTLHDRFHGEPPGQSS
jgi:RNA polymerase sigma factor (sigma-70 family)